MAALYDRHARAVLGLCRLLLRDPHEAEDAAQTTFLAAHRALLRGNEPRDDAAWITTIARNECRSRIRARMQAPTMAGEEALLGLVDPAAGPGDAITDPGVRRALVALPESQRDAVVLHDLFDLRAREVGAALGISLPAVEALLFRARRQLRVRLQPVAGALTVPIGVRDALSGLIPGFGPANAAVVGAGTGGGVLTGILAKLAAAPLAAKLAAGAAALSVGGVAAVDVVGPGGEGAPVAATGPEILVTQADGPIRTTVGAGRWPEAALRDPPRSRPVAPERPRRAVVRDIPSARLREASDTPPRAAAAAMRPAAAPEAPAAVRQAPPAQAVAQAAPRPVEVAVARGGPSRRAVRRGARGGGRPAAAGRTAGAEAGARRRRARPCAGPSRGRGARAGGRAPWPRRRGRPREGRPGRRGRSRRTGRSRHGGRGQPHRRRR